jgi:hypothetical protein
MGSPLNPCLQDLDLAIEVCLVAPPRQPIHPGEAFRLRAQNAVSMAVRYWADDSRIEFLRLIAPC